VFWCDYTALATPSFFTAYRTQPGAHAAVHSSLYPQACNQ
jgi:hypothetical protein